MTDVAALAALHAACFPHAPWDEAELRTMLAMPGTRCWRDGQAFLILRSDGESADVLALGTHPNAQRQGLAEALMRQAEQELASHSVGRIVLEVNATNLAAAALYDKLGYHLLQRRKDYYRTPEGLQDALVMERRLA